MIQPIAKTDLFHHITGNSIQTDESEPGSVTFYKEETVRLRSIGSGVELTICQKFPEQFLYMNIEYHVYP